MNGRLPRWGGRPYLVRWSEPVGQIGQASEPRLPSDDCPSSITITDTSDNDVENPNDLTVTYAWVPSGVIATRSG
ncbi:hypothetical protein [Rhodococcus marinonascens]|uniref:hypothetical protein n=1 Tax=Rhodococcus marinonascens TaxID=38311 RepID=UPI001475C687|nr:hypothetical protein [Rhodococcus marinonascens]